MSEIRAIETRYAGCRFRSRTEARWAVFFDRLGVAWQYEPQGFVVDGRPYLPDFLLTDCGTWVEVKGTGADLDETLMLNAARLLPAMPCVIEPGPRLLILGAVPTPTQEGDWGWVGLDYQPNPDGPSADPAQDITDRWWGFGSYRKLRRPRVLVNTSCAPPVSMGEPTDTWLTPALDPYEVGAPGAYLAARSARFEHGERG